MRSIRLSLLAWFLGLLAVALGGLSLFVYQTSSHTLREKERATADLLRAQYKERCAESEKQLNTTLLDQARVVASARFHFDRERWRYRGLHLLGMTELVIAPSGYALAPLWIGQAMRSQVSSELGRMPDYAWHSLAEVDLEDLHLDETVAQFVQIDSARGPLYKSDELRHQGAALHWEKEAKKLESGPVAWAYFETELEGKRRVRAVVLKTPEPRWQPFFPGPGRGGPRPYGERPPGSFVVAATASAGLLGTPAGSAPVLASAALLPTRPPPSSGDLPLRPPMYVSCACDLSTLRADLGRHHDKLTGDLADETDKTRESLADLRNRLLLLGAVTLGGVVLGGIVTVRRGLAPLDRLSDAVSRVSAKDFQLPFAEHHLPAELAPIVERLKQALGQLRRAFEREKQATADLSHELRTPLAALLTTTEIALRKPRAADEYRELLGDCRTSAQQMNQTIERLLTLARLDAGVDQLRPQAVDAADLAEQCAAVVRPLAEARHLTLKVHRNGAVRLTIDPDKLREVVTNLLHNAIQYNRPDGAVDLSVAVDGGRLQVAVCDTGIGIAPEVCGHIFERFYRADPSRGADGLHCGLGLAIVKEYVDLMGGSIDVESAPGRGSTFRVSLPMTGRAA